MKPHAPHEKAKRHIRKYADGALGEDKSFYFSVVNALELLAATLVRIDSGEQYFEVTRWPIYFDVRA